MTAHACPHCGQDVFRAGSGKIKARTTMLVVHKSGDAEINCGSCGRGVIVGTVAVAESLRKAEAPRPVVPRA